MGVAFSVSFIFIIILYGSAPLSSEETSQRGRADGDFVSSLTGPGIVPTTSRVESNVYHYPNQTVIYDFYSKIIS